MMGRNSARPHPPRAQSGPRMWLQRAALVPDTLPPCSGSPNLSDDDRLRLVILFALKYEKEGVRQVGAMVSRLQEYGIDKRRTDLVHGILRYCGSDKRLADVFSNKNFYARATSIARGLKGVENVYTQHVPILNATVEAAVKGKLPVQDYPEISDPSSTGLQPQKAPREVIVFVIGGTTYEESRFVAQMNSAAKKGDSSNGSARVLLGGTAVCNGKSFLSDFEAILAAEH